MPSRVRKLSILRSRSEIEMPNFSSKKRTNCTDTRELMNPNEALSLGSISQIVMPSDLRQVLAENMAFYLRRYQPEPLQSVQREFH